MGPVFLNGAFLEPSEARVSAFDAGLQHGVGLFETLLAIGTGDSARVLDLEAHTQRLEGSARELGLSEKLRVEGLEQAVRETIGNHPRALEPSARSRVRLTVTGGDLNLLDAARAGAQGGAATQAFGTVMVEVKPATPYPDEMFERGVMATVADMKPSPIDPTSGHKTLNYWPRLRTLQQAASRGAGEALVLDVTHRLCGGCVSNALLVTGGVVRTPTARGEEASGELPSGVLPGVVRGWALEALEAEGHEVQRGAVSIDDVLDADEIMLTNSSWGVLPVVAVEGSAAGSGQPGDVFKGLRRAWLERLG